MDKIDIRDLIVRILKENEFGTTDQTGNELRVVEDCDFVDIAESVVKNLPIYVVMQQRELLLDYEIYNASEDDKENNMKYLENLVDTYLANNCG